MIEGFFTKKEVESITRPAGKVGTCVTCGLHRTCESPQMKPFGNFKKKILNIGEAPGEAEDRTGKPWQGKVGKLLERTYASLGIDLFEDCVNINAVLCRPTDLKGSNRPPSNFEAECCRRSILRTIEEYCPHKIIILGNTALYSIIGHRWMKDLGTISKWRGFTIPDLDFNAWLCPTFHPSYIERAMEQPDVQAIWKRDLKQAFALGALPKYNEPEIEIIDDLSVLKRIKGPVAIDYETTGLKPHAAGHRVVCAAVADSPDHTYAFLMPETKAERQPFLDLLANPKVGKMAHNMKFEDTWSVVRLRQPVVNWYWDSMQAAHILDNRPGITSLKFQTYVQLGVVDYASEISPYLHAVDNNDGNGLNRVLELLTVPGGTEKLLTYCALDTIYEYRLAMLQQSQILLPF